METEYEFAGDTWYWIDDNAKVLEAYIIPGVYENYIEDVDHIVNFVMEMS